MKLYELREWHRRGTLPYRAGTHWDYTCAKLQVVPTLVDWWRRNGITELDDELVERIYMSPGTSHRDGETEGERLRIAKLILDAAREIYHLVGLGDHADIVYVPTDDALGIDAHILARGVDVPVQITCDTSGKWAGVKARRRKLRGVANAALLITINPEDRACQPWVPAEYQYKQIAEELDRRFEAFTI